MTAKIYILDPSDYTILNTEILKCETKESGFLFILKDHHQLLYDNETTDIQKFEDWLVENELDDSKLLEEYFLEFEAFDSRDYVFLYS